MRYALMIAAILATGCGGAKGCKACANDDDAATCRQSVQTCNLLGPVGLLLRQSCLDSAYAVCDSRDTGTPQQGTDTDTSVAQ